MTSWQHGKYLGQGRIYREKASGNRGEGAVALVLGAGNEVSVAAGDVLHKLLVDDCVVILKANPVLEYMAPFLECGPSAKSV